MKKEENSDNNIIIDRSAYNGLSRLLYLRLPQLLKDICHPIKEIHEKDLVLLSSLIVLSNIIPVCGIYDSRKIYPNLFLFITANASAGKGVLKWVRILGSKIHKDKAKKYKKAFAEYMAMDIEEMKETERPIKQSYYIAGNSSLAAMIRQLSNNNGFGIIIESEADTLNVAMKNDWGNYSEVLRKAFEFETISMLRQNDENSFEIDDPRLSVVLTGTKNQLLDFIPSTENGLFSRFMFMEFPLIKKWKDVFDNNIDFYDHYNLIANRLLKVYNASRNSSLKVSLSVEQRAKFHEKFEKYQSQYDALLGEDSISSIRRIGNMHFRICLLLTGIRLISWFETKTQNADKESKGFKRGHKICSEEDFEIANEITLYLLSNLKNIYGYIPTSTRATKNLNRKQTLLYEILNTEFSFSDFKEEVKKLNIALSTAEGYLRLFKRSGLVDQLEHGKYIKIKL